MFLSGVETWIGNEFAIFNAFSIWHFRSPQIPPTLFGANLGESGFKITVFKTTTSLRPGRLSESNPASLISCLAYFLFLIGFSLFQSSVIRIHQAEIDKKKWELQTVQVDLPFLLVVSCQITRGLVGRVQSLVRLSERSAVIHQVVESIIELVPTNDRV